MTTTIRCRACGTPFATTPLGEMLGDTPPKAPTLKDLQAALATAQEAARLADAEVRRIQAEITELERATARAAMEKKIAGLPPDVIEALRGEPVGALVQRGFARSAGGNGRNWRRYAWTEAGTLARKVLGVE